MAALPRVRHLAPGSAAVLCVGGTSRPVQGGGCVCGHETRSSSAPLSAWATWDDLCFRGAAPFVGSLTLLSCLSTAPLPKPFQKTARACHLFPAGTVTRTIWKGDRESSGLPQSHHEVRRGPFAVPGGLGEGKGGKAGWRLGSRKPSGQAGRARACAHTRAHSPIQAPASCSRGLFHR